MSWLPDLDVALATTPLVLEQLTTGERERFDSLPAFGPRRREWLTGRRALRQVGGRHRSLSHAGGMAVAVGADRPVGVDIEVHRPSERTARFFVRDDDGEGDLLQLWSAKEAVFKADPDNAGRVLIDYRVTGGLAEAPDGRVFDVLTTALPRGVLSIAVSRCS